MLLTLVPEKLFVITIIEKTFELVFNHFFPSIFMDLERFFLRGKIGGSRVGNKRGFLVLGKDKLLCFFDVFSSFQPSLGMSHEGLGLDFIL
jgi:hypothetical protein